MKIKSNHAPARFPRFRAAWAPLSLLPFLLPSSLAQPTSSGPLAPPPNGPRKADSTWTALTDCTVHPKAGETLYRAAVVFRDGAITAIIPGDAGKDAKPGTDDDTPARAPLGPRLIDGKGLHVYPAFIDAYVEIDASGSAAAATGGGGGRFGRGGGGGAQPEAPAPKIGAHWNQGVTPQRSALDGPGIDAASAKSLREAGFAAAAISPKGGTFKGRSAVVSLLQVPDDPAAQRPAPYREDTYTSVSIDSSFGGYPSSQMGSIALVRQTLSDADWQAAARARGEFTDPVNALDFLASPSLREGAGGVGERPTRPDLYLFDTAGELESFRVAQIAREFSRPAAILGCGTEFARLEGIKSLNLPYILPLNFPKAPDVASPSKAEAVELRELMTWEQAPTNPRRLAQAGVPFSLTTAKLKSRGDFLANLRSAIKHGLTEDQALAALTTTPADMLGIADQVGTVEPGKRANLLVTTGSVFAKDTKFRMIFVDGHLHELEKEKVDLLGDWDVEITNAPPATRRFEIDADNNITLHRDDKSVKCTKVSVEKSTISLAFDHEPINQPAKEGEPKPPAGIFLLSGAIERDDNGRPVTMTGTGMRDNGDRFDWKAARRVPSLAGHWPVVFEAKGHDGPVLVFDDKNNLTTLEPVKGPDGNEVKIQNFAWDGATLSYELDMSQLGATGVAKTVATIDFKKDPAEMTGRVETSAGGSFPFAAARRKDHAFVGKWRVTEFEGKVKDPADPDQLNMEVTASKQDDATTYAVKLTLKQKEGEPTVIEAKDVKIEGATLTFAHSLEKLGGAGDSADTVKFVSDTLDGVGLLPDGTSHPYKAARADDGKKKDDDDTAPTDIPEKLGAPFGPYSLDAYPAQKTFVLRHATVWTNTDKEILDDATVVISGGKISAVGLVSDQLVPADAVEIDATGKHLTPGLIDCHSHTGISRGVNEGGQAVTAEVRIGDVTNPDDVNWYRQLAGGVTAVNNLHGSANAIGGQSQTNKLRWGCASPDDMHFEGAIPGIKFALGENPRQVNWGSNQSARYPKTRMGVETLIRDRFTAAREYAAAMNDASRSRVGAKQGGGDEDTARPRFSNGSSLVRRDLELEALAEVLAGQRLVHCHSYRQDEILMLALVAKDFNFKIGTYQHILEGYKVADYVRDYSGGGSGFTDWWAYKMEVQDAIPAGLPLMQKVGATMSFNSDSNELARRLNTEAAKAVKYGALVGGFTEAEALKFVTLNPAKQLKIDNRVGTIEPGKDADVVLWDMNPLSTMSKPTNTWVDGRELFSLEQDAKHRQTIRQERSRLIQKLLSEGKKDKKEGDQPEGRRPRGPRPPRELTEDQQEQLRLMYLETLESGKDPRFAPGVCGCGELHAN